MPHAADRDRNLRDTPSPSSSRGTPARGVTGHTLPPPSKSGPDSAGSGSGPRTSTVARRLAPYGRLFALPGARKRTAGSLLARLPMGMFSVSVVIMVATVHGSYALAGAVTATGLAATAVVGPLTARLIDRYGQSRVALSLFQPDWLGG
jgi:hypothetical protein